MLVIRERLYAHPVDHMMFAACMAVSFITFFYILLVPFFIIDIWLYVFYASVNFTNYVFIAMLMYTYCYVCSVIKGCSGSMIHVK